MYNFHPYHNDYNTAAAICIKVDYTCIFMIHGYKLFERKLLKGKESSEKERERERERENI